MGISDLIADFIDEMLEEQNGAAQLQRAKLASHFSCVPSQINYVISTRFSPERGYVVESRRGGNGYIRIRRVQLAPNEQMLHTVNAIGDRIDGKRADAFISNLVTAGTIGEQCARLIKAALGDSALRPVAQQERDAVRASILKQILINLIQ